MELRSLLTELTGNGPVDTSFALPEIVCDGRFDSPYPVSTLASLAVGAASHCLQSYVAGAGQEPGGASVSQELASLWFQSSVRPRGWPLPPSWDDIAGVYRARDNFIRLHTNAAHHRAAALRVLGSADTREQVAEAVNRWSAAELEQAIVNADGCAAQLRSLDQWQCHEQGQAVGKEPLVHWQILHRGTPVKRAVDPAHPLRGIRVLDLTRVLAGPTSTRWLAAFGATVLRLDPDYWDEPACTVEMSAGKRRAALDLRTTSGKQIFLDLLSRADVLVHGYRGDALERLGLGEETRRQCNPALVDVALCAYGWTGPWRHRRGFDSLVQMSCGIAHEGARACGSTAPVPLPVQALDHATGYLMAASALYALDRQQRTGEVLQARLSLARTACLLEQIRAYGPEKPADTISGPGDDHYQALDEQTDWGPMQRLKWPVQFEFSRPGFEVPAGNLRTAEPAWY